MTQTRTATLANFIGGKFREPRAELTMPVINPANESEYARAPLSSAEDVDLASRTAEEAVVTMGCCLR